MIRVQLTPNATKVALFLNRRPLFLTKFIVWPQRLAAALRKPKDLVRSGRGTFEISLRIYEGGCARTLVANFGPHPWPLAEQCEIDPGS
jgi:hypothetical protein